MPGETGLTRVASDRTVARALVATCARVAPAMCHNFVIHQRRSTHVSNAQLRRRALAKPPNSTMALNAVMGIAEIF